MELALKACAHCGCRRAKTIKGSRIDGSGVFYKAYCPRCQIRTDPCSSRKKAAAKWNRRTLPKKKEVFYAD